MPSIIHQLKRKINQNERKGRKRVKKEIENSTSKENQLWVNY